MPSQILSRWDAAPRRVAHILLPARDATAAVARRRGPPEAQHAFRHIRFQPVQSLGLIPLAKSPLHCASGPIPYVRSS
jgi:hypothetical protein